ncbi:MAG: 3-methyl-2-oxobutanoate hydroxymethyltransferase [Xanthomonadaceae bacterium]|nr:3-methyl-2-oxobutanoate hydroxymethyltransferase [Xanthomonadaceae bacterium]MDE2083887.1 3-methyl-2-oxobutanoate hydroxymethyltransferase [Xanthomonadaceae bacterium]
MYANSKSSATRPAITVPQLHAIKAKGEKIVMLTAYDASFAAQCDTAGVDAVLVGDSLGMVVQGHASTLPVSVDDMVYHTAAVARGVESALLIADMPFMSFRDADTALRNAGRLLAEGGAAMVKLEGAGYVLDVIGALARHAMPVCAHLGLTPQSVHKLGGYRVQGKSRDAAAQLVADARAVADAGADLLVLECVPAALAKRITLEIPIPTVGIGAGADCDGQVLVLYDMLGITPGKRPKFSKDFLAGRGSIGDAIRAYAEAVRNGSFPAAEHAF